MRKILKGALLALGASLMAMPALAGQTQPAIVDVDLDNFFASGDLISARTAKTDTVFLGCGTRNNNFGGPMTSWAFCQAEDSDGDRVICRTDDQDMVKTIREMNSDSYVVFFWSDDGFGNLTCNYLGFSTQSFYLDKHTKGNAKGNDNP